MKMPPSTIYRKLKLALAELRIRLEKVSEKRYKR